MSIADHIHAQASQSFLFLPDGLVGWNAGSLYTVAWTVIRPIDGRGYHDGYLPSYLQVEFLK